jgi:serine/threonine protein kinase
MKVRQKDIKPANILVIRGRVLLADFGISKDFIDQQNKASSNSNNNISTRIYSAPEILSKGHRRGRAADIYSLGCIFQEISLLFF